MGKKKFMVLILAVSFGLINMSCGASVADKKQVIPAAWDEAAPEEPENAKEGAGEDTIHGKAAGREVVLENEELKECVYLQLGKEEGSPLYEEELEPYKSNLGEYSSFEIKSGDDLDFVRIYFNLDTFYDFDVTFTPDGSNWTAQQLQGLGDLPGRVSIRSTEDTVPAEVLTYLTGAEELIFAVMDITGEAVDHKVPENIKKIQLDEYATGSYTNLLSYMQNSAVESLVVCGKDEKNSQYFRLDQIAGMKNLLSLNLQESCLWVDNPDNLSSMPLQYLHCCIDGRVDFSFLKELHKLELLEGEVIEVTDLSPLFEREGLALRIRFCQEMVEFEEDLYPEGRAVIIPKLDEELGWKEEDADEEHFLAIYQRFMDGEKKIECFSIRCIDEDEGDMQHVRTFLKVTAGGLVQLLIPERDDPEREDFGDFRTDNVAITDINFDGANDIMLYTGGFGNQLANYAFAWIWDEKSGQYVRSESFRQIINPSVDTEQNLVRSFWRNSAASHSWAIYRYEDGEYKIQSELTESELWGDNIPADMQVPDGAEVWEWVEVIYEEESAVDTKSFTVLQVPGEKAEYPDAYFKFYEPDSYWGY